MLHIEFDKDSQPASQEQPPEREYVPTPMVLSPPPFVGFVSTDPDHSYSAKRTEVAEADEEGERVQLRP